MAGRAVQLGLGIVALVCWAVMFLAGTDVWHDVGRPDFWNLQGAPYNDLRAFTYAFYLLFALLCLQVVGTTADVAAALWRRRDASHRMQQTAP